MNSATRIKISVLSFIQCGLTGVLWVVCFGLFTVAATAETLKEPVRVETGLITGVAGKTDGVRIFKGIP